MMHITSALHEAAPRSSLYKASQTTAYLCSVFDAWEVLPPQTPDGQYLQLEDVRGEYKGGGCGRGGEILFLHNQNWHHRVSETSYDSQNIVIRCMLYRRAQTCAYRSVSDCCRNRNYCHNRNLRYVLMSCTAYWSVMTV